MKVIQVLRGLDAGVDTPVLWYQGDDVAQALAALVSSAAATTLPDRRTEVVSVTIEF